MSDQFIVLSPEEYKKLTKDHPELVRKRVTLREMKIPVNEQFLKLNECLPDWDPTDKDPCSICGGSFKEHFHTLWFWEKKHTRKVKDFLGSLEREALDNENTIVTKLQLNAPKTTLTPKESILTLYDVVKSIRKPEIADRFIDLVQYVGPAERILNIMTKIRRDLAIRRSNYDDELEKQDLIREEYDPTPQGKEQYYRAYERITRRLYRDLRNSLETLSNYVQAFSAYRKELRDEMGGAYGWVRELIIDSEASKKQEAKQTAITVPFRFEETRR